MKFINKLRKITNGSDTDADLIDECMTVIKKVNPDIFTIIPQDVQNELMKIARQQKHSCIFDENNYFSFVKSYNITNPKIIKQLQNIIQKARYNSLFVVEDKGNYVDLRWKYLDNECNFEFSERYGDLSIYVHFGLETCAKILEKSGFDITFNSHKQTLKVEW